MTSEPAQSKSKASVELVDRISVAHEPLKLHHEAELDRFGAAAKTDPAEIALVKKIDLYMLVRVRDTFEPTAAHVSSPFSGSCISSTFSIEMPLSTASSTDLTRISA